MTEQKRDGSEGNGPVSELGLSGSATETQQAPALSPYGCNRCGQPREAHEGDDLRCPGQREFSRAKWSDPDQRPRWTDDGHKLTATIAWGSARPVLIHPKDGCIAAYCLCRGEYRERDPDPNCSDCGGTGIDPKTPCWLQGYIDDCGSEFFEFTDWLPDVPLTEPVPILYFGNDDEIQWRPRNA